MAWDIELKGFIELHTTNEDAVYFAVAHVRGFGISFADKAKAWIQVGATEDDIWVVTEDVAQIAMKLYADQKESPCETTETNE